mgnify:CR=1 FL=1
MKLKKIKPMFNSIVTTCDKFETAQYIPGTSMIDNSKPQGSVEPYQTVVAVGEMVRCIKPGDIVMINPRHYEVKKFKEDSLNNGVTQVNSVLRYEFNTIILNDKEHLYLQDRDIDFIIEEGEEDTTSIPLIETSNKQIIL